MGVFFIPMTGAIQKNQPPRAEQASMPVPPAAPKEKPEAE
jgi:hypothetical protein